jgi:hypothetical protein
MSAEKNYDKRSNQQTAAICPHDLTSIKDSIQHVHRNITATNQPGDANHLIVVFRMQTEKPAFSLTM